jgi:signal transduction histidine kinase
MHSDNAGRVLRPWLIVATAAWSILAALPWVSSFGTISGHWTGTLAATVVIGVAALLLLLAARRQDLAPRLRQALALYAVSASLAAAGNFLRFVAALGVPFPRVPGLDITTTVAIWAIGLAGLLRFPLAPVSRGAAWQLATDTTIAVGGLALMIFAIWTLPGLRAAPPSARAHLLTYNLMEAANLVALTLILVRGPVRPIRAAYWWLAATIVIETTYLVAFQYALGSRSHDFRLPNSLFFVDYLAYLYAGALFLTRPEPAGDVALLPESLRAFNPLTALAILGIGAVLTLSALNPAHPALLPLAVGIVVLALLLLVRVVGATGANLRLLREDAAEEARRYAERQQLMLRLAGGIAHVINNNMTVVMGHASLLASGSGDVAAHEDAKAIEDAAQRSAVLAARLLLTSGETPGPDRPRTVADLVLEMRAQPRPAARGRELQWDIGEGSGGAVIGRAAFGAIMDELIANASEATADAGPITVGLRDEAVSPRPERMLLTPAAGRYSVVVVSDTGRGMTPDAAAHAHEPFFTTRPRHEGRGLGLSVVYGIVSGLGGGLRLESQPGAGTRVSVYLPIAPRGGSPEPAPPAARPT